MCCRITSFVNQRKRKGSKTLNQRQNAGDGRLDNLVGRVRNRAQCVKANLRVTFEYHMAPLFSFSDRNSPQESFSLSLEWGTMRGGPCLDTTE